LVEHLKIAAEYPADLQQEHDYYRGPDGGKGNIPDLLKNIGPVYIGGLITFRINGADGGDIDDRIVAAPFPCVKDADNDRPYPGHTVDINRLLAKKFKDVVHCPGFVIKNIVHETAHNNPGNKIGQEDNRLAKLFIGYNKHLRDTHGDNDRQALGSYQVDEIVQDSVSGNYPACAGGKEETEVRQPIPGAAENAQIVAEILEGKDKSRHGYILEDKDQKHRRGRHKKKRLVFGEFPGKIVSVYHTCP